MAELTTLVVFDRLDVGPVKLEKKRLTAPYRLTMPGGETAETELIYSFEENVFDPMDTASVNLADMMAAQVAINYGLFCKRIEFHGAYDAQDRKYIRTAMENTAREIIVKKFLEPNPFLVGEAARVSVRRQKRYSRAAISFRDVPGRPPMTGWHLWEMDKRKYCVLSSGGKDSLLSFGLLDDIRKQTGHPSAGLPEPPVSEVHPIFVNESGRHWFTALNAYRYFRDHIPHTARVWVNSDRVFAWFLKQMPFIRKDFASVRADIYPIRLWTVAVFLFGVLPLMKKRGIGQLVIGDEHDTTVTSSHEGIHHYDGLYDQSIFFDNSLTAYFLKKGWSVSQFSILRPLSELLIETILVRRYPELQHHQVSCHAGHKEEERIRPCGRCEKCRRIVGMLTAVGADAAHCGYTKQQIGTCLEQLVKKGAHQEAEGVQHLLYLLGEKSLLPEGVSAPLPRNEVMTLRFHPRRSPFSAIPMEIRQPLYRICLETAAGTVKWRKGKWQPTDIFSDADFRQPYPFDLEPAAGPEWTQPSKNPDGKGILWGELTWPDAAKRIESMDVALLPVGAIEQHGPHLPLDTDAFDAAYLARRVAGACSEPRPLVLPLIAYGVSYHHDDFTGTISIRNETLSQLVYDVGMGAAAAGIRKLVIINGHGGNGPALNYAAQMINRDARIFVCVDTGETSDVDIESLISTPNDVHAGEIETSTTLAIRPELVKMNRAKASVPAFSSRYLDFTSKRGVTWYAYTQSISKSGVMGDPTLADARKGARIWEIMVAHLTALVDDLKSMTLDEIHQRKY